MGQDIHGQHRCSCTEHHDFFCFLSLSFIACDFSLMIERWLLYLQKQWSYSWQKEKRRASTDTRKMTHLPEIPKDFCICLIDQNWVTWLLATKESGKVNVFCWVSSSHVSPPQPMHNLPHCPHPTLQCCIQLLLHWRNMSFLSLCRSEFLTCYPFLHLKELRLTSWSQLYWQNSPSIFIWESLNFSFTFEG